MTRSGSQYSAPTDSDRRPALFGVSSSDLTTATVVAVDPSTNRLLVQIIGTVTVVPSGTQDVNITKYGGTATTLGQKTKANSLPVTLASDEDTLPISATSLPLPTGAATSANQSTVIANLQTLNSLIPSVYDYISLSYTGADLTTVAFKSGGAGGLTVSTLTLAYSGVNLVSVTKT